ncbi:MAG: DUF5110 domain-containing protein [Candidatus Adiutrix intracellularis]|jgi:alpha-glucosidase|nr:DUF5110 domain-containing protein [Candidatus Adiutrix intracellularis]
MYTPLKFLAKLLFFFLILSPETGGADTPDHTVRTVAKLETFYLSLALLGDNIWLFELSSDQNLAKRPYELSTMVAPGTNNTLKAPADGTNEWSSPTAIVRLTQNPPLLTISQKDGTTLFNISPYAPDGQLTGLTFSGPFSHLQGLGADFNLQNNVFNLMGQTIMPGGPFGNARLSLLGYSPNQVQIPILYGLGEGLHCAALFVDETLPLQWNFKTQPWTVSATGPLVPNQSFRFFIITGSDMPALRSEFMALTGRPPVPPKRIMGVWVSGLDKELLQVEGREKLTRLQNIVPGLSGITAGLDADLETLLTFTKANNLGLILDESAYIHKNSPYYAEMDRRNFLVRLNDAQGPSLEVSHLDQASGLIDYTNSAVPTFWHSLFREKQITDGLSTFRLVDGDLNEASPNAWYEGSGPQSVHSHYALANSYTLKWLDAINTAAKNQWLLNRPRLFLMTRTGTAGLARLSGALYNGNTFIFANGFSGLSTFGARLSLALSGVDYYSSDLTLSLTNWSIEQFFQIYDAWLAKFALIDYPLVLPEELLLRPNTQYNLALRESLSPYTYNQTWNAYLNGRPLVAPLTYYFQNDPVARDRLTEIMLGPSLLLSLNLSGNAERTEVYVPKGRWYNWHTGELIDQPESTLISLDVKYNGLITPPLLARSGAIIPALEQMTIKDGITQKISALKIFIGEEPSEIIWYEDDGYSQSYLRKDSQNYYSQTKISAVSQPDGSTVVTIKAREGGWTNAPGERPLLIDIYGPKAPGQATLDNLPHNRVAQVSALDNMNSGWASFGHNRIRFKTPPLNMNTDHVLWFK